MIPERIYFLTWWVPLQDEDVTRVLSQDAFLKNFTGPYIGYLKVMYVRTSCIMANTVLKVTIRPGFSGTVPIFKDVSRKKNHSFPGTPVFGFMSRICPDLPIFAAYAYAALAKN